jgi:hypothetical protein
MVINKYVKHAIHAAASIPKRGINIIYKIIFNNNPKRLITEAVNVLSVNLYHEEKLVYIPEKIFAINNIETKCMDPL